jgi:DNA-binding NarL/FixJ family response regulator
VRARITRRVVVDTQLRASDRHILLCRLHALRYDTEPWDGSMRRCGAATAVVLAVPQRTVGQVRDVTSRLGNQTVLGASHRVPDAHLYRTYIPVGVTAIIGLCLPTRTLTHVVAMALQGLATIPTADLARIVDHPEEPPEGLVLDARDREILDLIARGQSPAMIAAVTGYSERHVRRITAELISRIGATNRLHAAAIAARWV